MASEETVDVTGETVRVEEVRTGADLARRDIAVRRVARVTRSRYRNMITHSPGADPGCVI